LLAEAVDWHMSVETKSFELEWLVCVCFDHAVAVAAAAAGLGLGLVGVLAEAVAVVPAIACAFNESSTPR
jgi:hypothetical protein